MQSELMESRDRPPQKERKSWNRKFKEKKVPTTLDTNLKTPHDPEDMKISVLLPIPLSAESP